MKVAVGCDGRWLILKTMSFLQGALWNHLRRPDNVNQFIHKFLSKQLALAELNIKEDCHEFLSPLMFIKKYSKANGFQTINYNKTHSVQIPIQKQNSD